MKTATVINKLCMEEFSKKWGDIYLTHDRFFGGDF
jgi:hypothetical protein